MPKHLTKRGKVYYVVARVNGKRVSQSTGEGELGQARFVAATILKAARAGRWEAIQETKARQPTMTVGEAIAAFEQRAAQNYMRNGRPRPETVTNYVSALRLVLRTAGIENPDAADLKRVDGGVAMRYAAAVIADSPSLPDRARRTAASTLRNARAVFSRWKSGIDAADAAVEAFCQAHAVEAPAVKYRFPAADLVAGTLAAGKALKEKQPDLYAAWVCCYYLGLRASEAAAAKWSWVRYVDRPDGARAAYLDIIRRDGYAPKRSERSVPFAPSVGTALDSVRQPGQEYLLPGTTPTERLDLIRRRLASWMRGIGWSRAEYPKAAHELRKLMGAEWYTRFGVEVACKWLGHTNIQTTHRYYADLTRHPDPIEME
jgi:integrase